MKRLGIRLNGTFEETLEDFAEQTVLVDEAAINASGRYSGPARDLRDRGAFDPAFFEDLLRRFEKSGRGFHAAALVVNRPRSYGHASDSSLTFLNVNVNTDLHLSHLSYKS